MSNPFKKFINKELEIEFDEGAFLAAIIKSIEAASHKANRAFELMHKTLQVKLLEQEIANLEAEGDTEEDEQE